MRKPVVVFAATRADLHPLRPVLVALAATTDLQPVLVSTEPTSEDLAGVVAESVATVLDPDTPAAMTSSGAALAIDVARSLERIRPDALVVLGDRWELLYVLAAALAADIPVVHLHGGEVTEGAIDDRIRHAVTKLADLHCVSTAAAAARIRQLGEPAARVVITGAPGLDRLAAVSPMDEAGLGRLLGFDVRRPFALLTYQPVTAGGPDPAQGARAVLDATATVAASVLVTHPGPDPGRAAVLAEICTATRRYGHVAELASLGNDYPAVLAAADVVVGNSSSGVFEAASLGVPVVDVGDRQRGRPTGANVLHVPEDREQIEAALRAALQPGFRRRARAADNPYGDGHAAERIVSVVRRATEGSWRRKPFVDLAICP